MILLHNLFPLQMQEVDEQFECSTISIFLSESTINFRPGQKCMYKLVIH